jgi:hypothetical protein
MRPTSQVSSELGAPARKFALSTLNTHHQRPHSSGCGRFAFAYFLMNTMDTRTTETSTGKSRSAQFLVAESYIAYSPAVVLPSGHFH